jgi:hypothetical protein
MTTAMLDHLSNTFVVAFSCGLLYLALTNRWLNAPRRCALRFGIAIAGLGVVQFCVVFVLFVSKWILGFELP